MELKEDEKQFLKKLEEFRQRPSKVSAELFYYTLTTPAWQKIQSVLFEWFDIYSEIDSSDLTTFDELRHLATSVRQEDNQRVVDICRVFQMLRIHNQELWQTDHRRVVTMLVSHHSPKSLICQMFICLMDNDLRGILKCGRQAFDKNMMNTTLSILASLPRADISKLRDKMREGHENGENLCDCKSRRPSLEQFSCVRVKNNGNHDSVNRKCGITCVIKELEELLLLMRSSKKDKTNLYKFHLRASRPDFSRHFLIKFKDLIDLDEVNSIKAEIIESECATIDDLNPQVFKEENISRHKNTKPERPKGPEIRYSSKK